MLILPRQLLCVLLALASASAWAATQYDSGNPTAAEQQVLEFINRARANPTAEGTRLGIDITEGISNPSLVKVQPPLAMNKALLGVAQAHSADMYNRNYFDHVNPDGLDPFERIDASGYNFLRAGENIATSGNSTATALEDLLMVDASLPGRGHRTNLLDITSGTIFREIGLGYFSGATPNAQGFKDFLTQDFGNAGTGPFLVGVVYNDSNSNNFYDPGEGLAGVTVTPVGGAFFAVSASAGGFAIPVGTSGTISVTASGGTLSGTITKTVTLAGENVKLDFKASEAGGGGGGGGGGGSVPAITSATSATGTVGSAFSYTISATNSPTSFGAVGLPAGLALNASTGAISGTPSAAGSFSVTLTATNAAGTGTATLALTVNPSGGGGGGGGSGTPQITSAPTAAATVNAPFSYTISATTAATFSAAGLPPGLSVDAATGVIAGIPTAAGSFAVILAATNASGTSLASLNLTVSAPGGGGGGGGGGGTASNSNTDSDSDGFADEIEAALGLSPSDPNSTPFGGSSAGAPQPLVVAKMSIKLNFAHVDRDGLRLSGTLPVPAGFLVAGQQVVVDTGGVVRSFTLDAKGKSPAGLAEAFKLRVKAKKGVVLAQQARWSAKFSRGNFGGALADEGLVSADRNAVAVTVPVIILFNLQMFRVEPPQLYTAKAGKTGKTK